MASPEQARGWIALLLPLFQRAGPIFTLLLLATNILTVWYLVGEIKTSRETSHKIYGELSDCHEDYIQHLARFAACQCAKEP